MNRKIKSRVWLTELETMIPASQVLGFIKEPVNAKGKLDRLCKYSNLPFREGGSYFMETESEEFYIELQYTGLKDKNGKEIYEGDILSICNGSINGHNWMEKNRSVEFKRGAFNVPTWEFDRTHWVEIIGNIYENPELINQPL